MRFRCGSVVVPVNWNCVVISSCFAILKNVVHSLEPGETPSNSTSHQAPNYATVLNIAKYFQTLRCSCSCGCVYFFNLLKTSTVEHHTVTFSLWNGFWTKQWGCSLAEKLMFCLHTRTDNNKCDSSLNADPTSDAHSFGMTSWRR